MVHKKLKKKLEATRNCGWWPEIEAVNLPENILGTVYKRKYYQLMFLK